MYIFRYTEYFKDSSTYRVGAVAAWGEGVDHRVLLRVRVYVAQRLDIRGALGGAGALLFRVGWPHHRVGAVDPGSTLRAGVRAPAAIPELVPAGGASGEGASGEGARGGHRPQPKEPGSAKPDDDGDSRWAPLPAGIDVRVRSESVRIK